MERVKADREGLKKGIGFIYLSVVIHFYILFLVLFTLDPSLLRTLMQMAQNTPKQEDTQNVIVDTQTESVQAPQNGMLSDKPNPDTGPTAGKKDYNYLNLNPAKEDRPASPLVAASKEDKKDDKSGAEVSLERSADADQKEADRAKPSVLSEPSDKRTSFFDPDRKIEVTMDNYGEISLATIPKEYASYFLNMQKKIGDNWKEFFPIFQYYQGIIKSGEVVVRFRIDPEGNVRNAEVTKSYGYSILDESSLNAVNYSRNFGPLPKALRSLGDININFRFIYIAR
jgi:TonB family protein